MADFKVGDRVRVYFASGNYCGTVIEVKKTQITATESIDQLLVREDGAELDPTVVPLLWSPKQCRRLKKKERHTIYVHRDSSSFYVCPGWPATGCTNRICIPFIEAPRAKT